MRAYRIAKKKHAAEAFTGEGAQRFGGRWNLPGTPVVYCAESRALAALESLGHFQGAERRIRFVIFTVEIPDELVMAVDLRALGDRWRAPEPDPGTQRLGSEWQRSMAGVALRVPSVHVPVEGCVLLNPEHADTQHVVIDYPADYTFDDRL